MAPGSIREIGGHPQIVQFQSWGKETAGIFSPAKYRAAHPQTHCKSRKILTATFFNDIIAKKK